MIGAAFGVGFIFGPALGGYLSAGGNYALPAFAAAGLAALNLIGALLWLPESLPPEKRTSPETKTQQDLPEGLDQRAPQTLRWTFAQCGADIRFGMDHVQTMFSLFTQQKLGFSAQATSYVLTYVGVLVVLVQGAASVG